MITADVLETGKTQKRKPLHKCLDCPAMIWAKKKRCAPCSDAAMAKKNVERLRQNRENRRKASNE
jgi:hypothetical protein